VRGIEFRVIACALDSLQMVDHFLQHYEREREREREREQEREREMFLVSVLLVKGTLVSVTGISLLLPVKGTCISVTRVGKV